MDRWEWVKELGCNGWRYLVKAVLKLGQSVCHCWWRGVSSAWQFENELMFEAYVTKTLLVCTIRPAGARDRRTSDHTYLIPVSDLMFPSD